MILTPFCRCQIVLGLAAAASLLELGPIVVELQYSDSVLPPLLAGLAYQAGNVAPRLILFDRRRSVSITAAGAALTLIVAPIGSSAWLAAIAVLSWTLQSIRRSIMARGDDALPTTVQKRTARVIGFAAASLFPPLVCLVLVCGAVAMATWLVLASPKHKSKVVGGLSHPIEWTMIIHQTHYFSYAYAVPLLIASEASGGIPLVGSWFACGWISYLSAETLWRRCPPPVVFVVGHTFLAVILLLVEPLSTLKWGVITLWVLSGFGGGSVYCLKILHRHTGLAHERLEYAEDIGHLVGVIFSITGVYFLNWTEKTLPMVGSFWAFTAAIVMVAILALKVGNNSFVRSKGAHDENQ